MSKKYVRPAVVRLRVTPDSLMIATSIQNATGDVQKPVGSNGDDDFEAGAKDNIFGGGGSPIWGD